MATENIETEMKSVGLHDDAGATIGVQATNLDQATFFRAVQEGEAKLIDTLLTKRKVDVNAYNSEGATALHLAVYKYEEQRTLDVVNTLLQHGADVSIKAAPPPSAHKISIVKHDMKNHDGSAQETKKISYEKKTALLIALELKSALYLKGWEYRHWDTLLIVLAAAVIQHYDAKKLKIPAANPQAVATSVQHNWDAVFLSGKHDLVELVAEGKEIVALRLLVTGASKIFKMNLLESSRMELHDTSFNLAKAMVHFLYVGGKLDPAYVAHRGIDLFTTAHKYGIHSLQEVLEASIVPTQENWIKLLTAAVEANSGVLTLKVAHSIKDTVSDRQSGHQAFLKKSFSEADRAPQQLFGAQTTEM